MGSGLSMGHAQELIKDKPINFGSLLESDIPSEPTPRIQKDPQERQLHANMITMSKQVERLMDSTNKLLNRPQEKQSFPWNYLFISVGVISLLSAGTYMILQQQHKTLSTHLEQKLNQNTIFTQQMIQEKTAILSGELFNLKNNHERNQQFVLDKINNIDKNVELLKQEQITNATTITVQKQQIEDLTANMILMQLDSPQELAQPLNTNEEESLQNKLNQWEFKQISTKNQAASFLDRYQSQKEIKSNTAPDRSFLEEKNKRFANAYSKLAWSETQKGNFEKAVSSYRKAIKLNPSFGTAYYNLACLYAKNGHRTEALLWIKQGRPHFSQSLIDTAFQDKDLTSIKRDPQFRSIMLNY